MIYINFQLAYNCKVSTIINENNFRHWLEKTKYYLLSYFQTRIILRKKKKFEFVARIEPTTYPTPGGYAIH